EVKMKRSFLFVFALLVTIGMISNVSSAQVKVKFVANTATISDTVSSGWTVTVTGNKITNWGTGEPLTNIGGDYWSTELNLTTGDTVYYKFRANGGWENGDNRVLIVGAADTTLPIQFYKYSGADGGKAQYFRPWGTVGADTLTVWVRVNMQVVVENKAYSWTDADVDSVVVMGDDKGGATPDLNWGTSHYLTREGESYFYSGRIRFAKSHANITPGSEVNYKFRLGDIWGRDEFQGAPNRKFPITFGETDTTLFYSFFNDDKPIARVNTDTCIITFNVDMAKAISSGGFSQGDTVVVQSGFFKTGAEDGRERQLNILIGTKYQVEDTIVTSLNKPLDYQFYLVKNNARIRENYFNFQYDGVTSAERERRRIVVSSKDFIVTDFGTSPSDARRQPIFPSQAKLTKDVTVKWLVDLRPAYAHVKAGGSILDEQGDATVINVDSIKVWGVGINGPATNVPNVYPIGDWATWNRDMVADTNKRKMWDNGTHGDTKANDTIYTVEITYPSGSNAGRVYKFGIRGGDNEGGNGKAFGNNHVANIVDLNSTFKIYTEFGSINPLAYPEWPYTGIDPTLGVGRDMSVAPKVFALDQNYPNPFNPTTNISFAVPVRSNVKLTVFNVVGQEVATLVNETMETGNHVVPFNASTLASGVYFYKLSAGSFTSVKKMMLLK
ncbi:MAG: T9SS type A sorting domain-containing protein, partial [Bacteroidota bacterium]